MASGHYAAGGVAVASGHNATKGVVEALGHNVAPSGGWLRHLAIKLLHSSIMPLHFRGEVPMLSP